MIEQNSAYITYGEDITSSGIIKTQVFPLLKKIANELKIKVFFISIIRSTFFYDEKTIIHLKSDLLKSNIYLEVFRESNHDETVQNISKFLLEKKVIITHARAYFASLFAFKIKTITNIPYIFDTRGLMPEETRLIRSENKDDECYDETYKAHKNLEQILIQNATYSIVVNKPCKDYYKKYYPNITNFKVIELFSDTDKFKFSISDRNKIRKQMNWENKTIITFSGTFFTPWYDISILLNWYLSLKKVIPNLFLLILTYEDKSNGNYLDILKSQIYKIINPDDIFINSDPSKNVNEWLSASDIATIPFKQHFKESLKVAQAIKITEYLTSGLFVISPSYSIEISNTIKSNPGCGILSEDEKIDDLSLQIIVNKFNTFQTEDELKLNRSQIAEIAIKNNYSFTSSYNKYEKLYLDFFDKPSLIKNQNNNNKEKKLIKIGYLSPDPFYYACPYIRLYKPLKLLAINGDIEFVETHKFQNNGLEIYGENIKTLDILIIQRHFAMMMKYDDLIEYLGDNRPKIIFEVDDLLTKAPAYNNSQGIYHKLKYDIEKYIINADLVTVTTQNIKNEYMSLNSNIEIIPNFIDFSLWEKKLEKEKPFHTTDKLTILLSGTIEHSSDYEMIEKVLYDISTKYPDKIKILLWGNSSILKNCKNVENIYQFTANYMDYVKKLKSLDIDIALIPLQDNIFNRAKSEIKFLEYSICKIPGIYSDIGVYKSITQNESGILAKNTYDDWYTALDKLLTDTKLRHLIAKNSYSSVLSKFLIENNTFYWKNIFNTLTKFPKQYDKYGEIKMNYKSRIFGKLKNKLNQPSKENGNTSYVANIFNKIKTTDVKATENKVNYRQSNNFKYQVGYFVSNETKEEFLKVIDFFTKDPELKLVIFFDEVNAENQATDQPSNTQVEYRYDYKNQSVDTVLQNLDLVIALEDDSYFHDLIQKAVLQNIFCVATYSEKLNEIIMKDVNKVLSVIHNFPEFYGYIDYVVSKLKVFKHTRK